LRSDIDLEAIRIALQRTELRTAGRLVAVRSEQAAVRTAEGRVTSRLAYGPT
jgi:hypothetical protein